MTKKITEGPYCYQFPQYQENSTKMILIQVPGAWVTLTLGFSLSPSVSSMKKPAPESVSFVTDCLPSLKGTSTSPQD
jgi:hypothetical protein